MAIEKSHNVIEWYAWPPQNFDRFNEDWEPETAQNQSPVMFRMWKIKNWLKRVYYTQNTVMGPVVDVIIVIRRCRRRPAKSNEIFNFQLNWLNRCALCFCKVFPMGSVSERRCEISLKFTMWVMSQTIDMCGQTTEKKKLRKVDGIAENTMQRKIVIKFKVR